MSTLEIIAGHFATIPVRYAIGRWYNIPTNTLLAFNAADLGLGILSRTIVAYSNVREKLTFKQEVTLSIVFRSCVALSALYITAKLTNRMPTECAMVTVLTSVISLNVLAVLAKWVKGEK
jgi:hypothetical protein